MDIYSEAYFDSETLRQIARNMICTIIDLNSKGKGKKIDTIMSRGSSGCSIASAILALSPFPLKHVYVRKEGESAHKSGAVGLYGDGVCVIVDDFISTGDTIKNIKRRAKGDGKKVVAVLVGEYGNTYRSNTTRLKVYRCGIKNLSEIK